MAHGYVHIKKVLVLLLLAVVRPPLEYDSEVREANRTQVAALKSVVLGEGNHELTINLVCYTTCLP